MGLIDAEASSKLQVELLPGESILWAGRPNPSVIFHSDDWYLIPFSLFWVAFTSFWEWGVSGHFGKQPDSGPSLFMMVWGIPFILVGQYLLWGRYLYDGWLKRRTYYGVTSKRILIVQDGWNHKSRFNYIDVLPTIQKDGADNGTLWFGPKHPAVAGRWQTTRTTSRFSVGDTPIFADIDDVDSVYRMVLDLREQLTKRDSAYVR
jgi:hypothetical protein